jgi:fructose-specific phosphotransferase system IIA component
MQIVELCHSEWMTMDLQATDKEAAIQELASLLLRSHRISSLDEYIQAVREREAQVSTGVGMGIGIPHGKSPAVLLPSIAFGRSQGGVDFDAIDGEPVYLVFLLAVPSSFGDREYMKTLARLARLLVHESFREKLMAASSKEQVLAAIQESEAKSRREEAQ